MTTRGLCKCISWGRAHDVVWQQVQYAGDDLLHLSRSFRPSDRELCVNFLDGLGHTDSSHSLSFFLLGGRSVSVSYTHLTLPTNREV